MAQKTGAKARKQPENHRIGIVVQNPHLAINFRIILTNYGQSLALTA